MKESVKASEIKEGDEIWFPNSRHPQAVTSIEVSDIGDDHVTLHADETQWHCPVGFDVERRKVQVPDGGE